MFNRRSFVSLSSALAAGLSMVAGAGKASAKTAKSLMDIEPRGTVGRLERFPSLDLESKQDFMAGITSFANSELAIAARDRGLDLLKANGLDPTKELPIETSKKLFGGDQIVGLRDRVWYSAHNYEHDILDAYFHENADRYLAELEASDKAGPGKLELNPSIHIPDYTKHEIHQQPGGYVGNPFAGHIYHYATNMFYRGTNDQDQRHIGYAAGCPLPKDGAVRRILDLGTGIGQLAVTMKERFPNAEVHGIDIAAPMLRYAHMRASELGVDVNFSQRLAEDTQYPSNHFDIVISYIMFHEVTAEASRQIIAEAHRILRPGGVFYPMDFNQAAPPSALRQFAQWKDHHWNNERWRLEYASVDFKTEMRNVGFTVTDQSDERSTFGKMTGVKSA